jgi:hypothetical protein
VEMATKIGFAVERLPDGESGGGVGGGGGDGEDGEDGEDDANGSIHPSGFSRLRVPYMCNPRSMRPQEYDCGAFVARKQLDF